MILVLLSVLCTSVCVNDIGVVICIVYECCVNDIGVVICIVYECCVNDIGGVICVVYESLCKCCCVFLLTAPSGEPGDGGGDRGTRQGGRLAPGHCVSALAGQSGKPLRSTGQAAVGR